MAGKTGNEVYMKKMSVFRSVAVWAILAAFCFSFSGCAQLRDKFVRKRKEDEEPAARRYYAVKEYDVRPSLELYTKRYIFWKNWHSELLAVLVHASHKKTVVAAEQTLSNLMDMQRMLVDKKAEDLQGSIDEMAGIEEEIKNERITKGNEVRMRRKLETLERRIKRDFSYTKIRGFIRDDFRQQ